MFGTASTLTKNKDKVFSFKVSNPSLLDGKYVVYKIKGADSFGQPFDDNRRYNEFHQLRSTLVHNWPGVYIPSVPVKKIVGNKDVKFILERNYFLDRFFKQLEENDFLVASVEFNAFIQPG